MHRQDPVHLAEIQADTARRRVDMALQRRTDAEGNDRHAMFGAEADDLGHLGGLGREKHRIGRLGVDPGGGVAVLVPNRLAGLAAFTEALLENADNGRDPRLVAWQGRGLNHNSLSFYSPSAIPSRRGSAAPRNLSPMAMACKPELRSPTSTS